MDLGQKIKQLRIKKGLKQEELAKLLNCAQNTISQFETNKREPDIETLKKMKKIFGVSLDELLNEEHEAEFVGDVHYGPIVKENNQDLEYTKDLLKKLVNNGSITDPNNIKPHFLKALIDMIKLDAGKFLKNK